MMLALAGFLLESCSKAVDNSPYPSSRISGAFLYNGQPVGLLGTSSDNASQNPLQLVQTGPGAYSAANIKFFARNDGTYTILTFNGNYTIQVQPSKGPFPDPPPLNIVLNGEAKDVNFNVTPYFWVSNYHTTFVDSVFTATFKLEQILTTTIVNSVAKPVTLEKVSVYFNTTNIVDATAKAFERTFTTPAQGVNINGNCTITVNLKGSGMSATEKAAIKNTTGVIYANVAVKTATVATDALYQTPVLLK